MQGKVTNKPGTKTEINPHPGGVIWLTGIPCAGKSTLSELVGSALKEWGLKVEILDGDVVRTHLSKGLGFSKEDRNENIRRIGFVARLLARNGIWVIVAAISPYRQVRDEVRKQVQDEGAHFIEVYVYCSLEVAEARDVKGLYKQARRGEIASFTGISDLYEEPITPEVVVKTDEQSPKESVCQIIDFLKSRELL